MNVTLFSDASLCEKHRIGGWAAWLKSNRGTIRRGGAFRAHINDITIAEAQAVVNGLFEGIRVGVIRQGDTVIIETDNDQVLGILHGTTLRKATLAVKTRRKISWKELKQENQQRNGQIAEVARYFALAKAALQLDFRWRHVKAHTTMRDPRSSLNRVCDRQAKAHMQAARLAHLAKIAV